jgi:CheY-like chemotaxis protein
VAAREEAQARLAQAQKMEAMGQLAGGVAHDFNNALQAVAGGARLILRRPGDAKAVERLARMVVEAADRGAAVARRLLAFARRGELRAEAVDAAALLADLGEVLAHTLGPSVSVAVEAPTSLPPLRADRAQLETVLVNLATNARDAMPGGGPLTLSAAAEEVVASRPHPRGLAPGTYLRIAVADAGQGIPPHLIERVAEPFFTTKPRGRGTGLGLAMAKGFAEQSGGAFAIESEVGVGTTVTVWLPRAEADVAARGQAEPALRGAGNGAALSALRAAPERRILLVDDEPLFRLVLAAELSGHGYGVVEAEGGRAAMERLDAGEACDLLVTDLAMPGVDGLALIREARQRRPGLPALLLTGYAGDGAALALNEAAREGAFALLRKPAPAGELADRVAALLAGGGEATSQAHAARRSVA